MKEQNKIFFSRYLDKCNADMLTNMLITLKRVGLHKERFAHSQGIPSVVMTKLFCHYTRMSLHK